MAGKDDSGSEISRVSLVRLREDLPRDVCLERWAGDHAEVVRELPGIVEYTVAISSEPRPAGSWDAIAILRFEDEAALRRFADDPAVRQRLLATRGDFAADADAFLVDERQIIPPGGTG
jgi:hypothetical protein